MSHESAVELYDLSDVIPNAVHITPARTKHGQRPRAGIQCHVLTDPTGHRETRQVDGALATRPERTIVDSPA